MNNMNGASHIEATTPIKLGIIIASTRPGRVGLPVAQWVEARAEAHPEFEVQVLDLAEINLPFMDEPNHPRLRSYTKQHTKDWSALVDSMDAFVIVTPEYNYAMNAPLKNAIDFLVQEWMYKPVGFVSYGGASGGTRAVQMIKQVVTTLKMFPLSEAVILNFVNQHINDEQQFVPTEAIDKALEAVLNELARLAPVFKPLHIPAPEPVEVLVR